jgi:hypothetical protein
LNADQLLLEDIMQKKQLTRIIVITVAVIVIALLAMHLGASFLDIAGSHLSGAGW